MATLSHEIRTPLNGVIGAADLLAETTLSPEQGKYVGIAQQTGRHLLSLLNDILDYSKLEARKVELETYAFDPRALVENQADLFMARARDRRVTLHTLIDPNVPQRLLGDPARVTQILINFLGNAIKFTEGGSVYVRAELEERDGNRCTVRFSVEDTGVGISAAAQQRLFKPFSQGDSSTARRFGGTGLGLSICKQAAELMGGTVGVSSVEGKGATFWLQVCLQVQEELRSDVAPADPIHALIRMRVLVVDSDPISQEIVATYLRSWDAEPQTVATGAEAMGLLEASRLAQLPFDAVITDWELADTNAFAFADRLRAVPQLAAIPLIITAAFDRRYQRQAAKTEGFSGYVTKPLKQRELYEVLLACRQKALPMHAQVITPSGTHVSRRHILVVEDNAVNQMVVLAHLKSLGCDAVAVDSGRAALRALAASAYDLVFMDCHMPDMDGYEATLCIREEERAHQHSARHLPIIALTASALQEDHDRCLATGMDDFITKPVTKGVLAKVIQTWLPSQS